MNGDFSGLTVGQNTCNFNWTMYFQEQFMNTCLWIGTQLQLEWANYHEMNFAWITQTSTSITIIETRKQIWTSFDFIAFTQISGEMRREKHGIILRKIAIISKLRAYNWKLMMGDIHFCASKSCGHFLQNFKCRYCFLHCCA